MTRMNLAPKGQYGRGWFMIEPDGTRTELPTCSSEYFPSEWMYDSCLQDPVGPICRRHRKFFLDRKVAHGI